MCIMVKQNLSLLSCFSGHFFFFGDFGVWLKKQSRSKQTRGESGWQVSCYNFACMANLIPPKRISFSLTIHRQTAETPFTVVGKRLDIQ